MFTMQKILR